MDQNNTFNHNDWITVKDLMEELHVGRSTAYALTHKIPIKRIGRNIRISRNELNKYLSENPEILL